MEYSPNDFVQRLNQIPKAEVVHTLKKQHLKGAYNISISCTDYLQDIYIQLLNIKRGWNFVNPSNWFLYTIKDFVEFVPDLLQNLQGRSVIPFLSSFRYTGTYYGFELLCIGIFGEDVKIEYVDPYIININGISSPINFAISGEGGQDFVLITEDLEFILVTEDEFAPPSGTWVIEKILRANLPAGIGEIVEINFVN